MKLAKELSDTVVYCKSVHFEGFDDPNHPRAFYEMSSFSESKALKLAQESGMCVLPSPVPVPQKGAAAGGKGIPKTRDMISLVKHITEKSGKNLISSGLFPRRAFLQLVPIQPDLPGRGEHTAAAARRDKSSPTTERAVFFCFFLPLQEPVLFITTSGT